MRAVRRRGTAPEAALAIELEKLGVRYEAGVGIDSLPRRRPDFVFRGPRVAVFVDGCFWHGCPVHATWPRANASWWREKLDANRARDLDTDRRLRLGGWTSVRVWAHESPVVAAQRIATVIRDMAAPY